MAASAELKEDRWQISRATIRERNKYMFQNSLLSDVKFVMRKSNTSELDEKDVISAHKYILAISSPVFFAMFYGDLAEKRNTIECPDCSSEGFLELLRYMYYDEVILTGNNVMQVLYLAKKYIVPSLATKCSEFLEHNLDEDNVLAVLSQAFKFSESRLVSQCWLILDEKANKVVKSQEFVSLDRELLLELVKRDSLVLKEIDLFQAVNRWAVKECKRMGMEGNWKEKREILGSILEGIRFPLMSEKEFAGVVLLSKLLDLDEVTDIIRFYNKLPVIDGLKFSAKPRLYSEMLECKRFEAFGGSWNYGTAADAISFSVNVPVLLLGFRLIGKMDCEYTAKMKFFETKWAGKVLWSNVASYNASRLGGCSYCGYDFLFENGVKLQKECSYTIQAQIKGPISDSGLQGFTCVNIKNVKFIFENSADSLNGTEVTDGQFPVLFFSREIS